MDDARARRIIERRLQPGETLVWHDRPSPWRAVGRPLLGLLFMTLWVGFAAFWTIGALGDLPPDAPKAASAFFLLVGGLFCMGGIVGWLWAASQVVNIWRTSYGLTDRRAIIAVGESGPTNSFGPSAFASLQRTGDKGLGSLLFDYGEASSGENPPTYQNGFFGIREPARVEALIYEHLLSDSPREKLIATSPWRRR